MIGSPAALIILMYLLIWISTGLGYWYGGTKNSAFATYLWNARIDASRRFPLNTFIRFYSAKAYVPTACMVILINVNMVIMQFLTGLVFLSPLLVLWMWFFAGSITVQGDSRTQRFTWVVLVFELGAFASAAALGLHLGIAWIVQRQFMDTVTALLESRLIFLPLILLLCNGLVEASGGPLDIEGVPGKTAFREGRYKNGYTRKRGQ